MLNLKLSIHFWTAMAVLVACTTALAMREITFGLLVLAIMVFVWERIEAYGDRRVDRYKLLQAQEKAMKANS